MITSGRYLPGQSWLSERHFLSFRRTNALWKMIRQVPVSCDDVCISGGDGSALGTTEGMIVGIGDGCGNGANVGTGKG